MFSINKMDFLVSVYILCIALAELLGAKTIHLFDLGGLKLNVSVAILVLPLIFTINDVVIEVFGKARARGIAQCGLVTVAGIMLFSLLATSLPPSSRFAATEAAYDTIFQASARISAASLTAFAVAEMIDVIVFAQIRQRLGTKKLWLRNNLSNFIAQFCDTSLFLTLAFYRFDQSLAANASFLIGLILPYWLLKCAASVVETPLVYLGVKWLRKTQPELRTSVLNK